MYLAPGTAETYVGISVPKPIGQPLASFQDGQFVLKWGDYYAWKVQRDVEITHLYFLGDEGSHVVKLDNPQTLKRGKKFHLDSMVMRIEGNDSDHALR